MGAKIDEPPLTEPLVIQDLAVTGASVERASFVLRVTLWQLMTGPEQTAEERRIVGRFSIPLDAASVLAKDIRAAARDAQN